MKKISMLMMALGITMMLSAEQVASLQASKTMQRANIAKATKTEVLSEVTGLKAPSAGFDDCDYYYIPGMMYSGFDEDWYAFNGILVAPGVRNMTFQNIFGATKWTWGGEEVSKTDKMNMVMAEDVIFNAFTEEGSISGFILPSTSNHTYQSKEGALSIKGYTYAEQLASQMMCVAPTYSEENHMMLTLCERYTNSVYSTQNEGRDFYIVNAGERGKYAFGSHLNVAKDGEPEKYADAIAQYVTVNGTLYINRIVCPIFSEAAESMVFPNGVELTATIYPIVDGVVNKDSVIAKSVITNEALHGFESSAGSIIFEFYEIDEFGLETQVPVIVNGDILIEYEGLNDCDFGFLSDYYCPVGSTYFQIDGEYTQLWSAPANLAISFDGYFPTIINDTTADVMYAPMEGGEIFYDLSNEEEDGWMQLWSNVSPYEEDEKWYYTVEYDSEEDWLLLYGFDDNYYEEYKAVFVKFLAAYVDETETQLLPAANEGYDREAVVTLTADGAEYTFTVKQAGPLGPKPDTAIENNSTAVKADKFIRNGQLVIRRGEKEFNAVGVQF